MAFVINKSDYKSVFDTANKTPGPGAYQRKQSVIEYSRAPFNASSKKKTCFDMKEQKLGPGSYSKTSPHDFYKRNSSCASSFNSKVVRFKYKEKQPELSVDSEISNKSKISLYCKTRCKTQHSNYPNEKLKQKKENLTKLRKENNSRKINSIVQDNEKKIRIILSNPKNTQNLESFYIDSDIHVKAANGPGQYEISKSLVERNKSVIDWSKDKQKRFQKARSKTSSGPGPGDYDLNSKQNRLKQMSSSFSYKGIRSFMDTVIYKTTSQTKVQIMQAKGITVNSPGPADYSPQKPHKISFYYGKQPMSSSAIQRFQINKDKLTIPGPGYYKNADCKLKYVAMVKEMRDKIFSRHGTLVKNQQDNDIVPLEKELQNAQIRHQKSEKQIIPCTLKERCQSKAGTISHQSRFKPLQKSQAPGPGQYYSMYEERSMFQNNNPAFKSTSQRLPFTINENIATVPYYQVGKEDIAYRTFKIRQNIESLRKVAIEKPGFDSSVKRFYVNQKQVNHQENNITEFGRPYQRDQINYEEFKPYKQQTNYASVFLSTSKRQSFVPKKVPGPGSYQSSDLLNKKSFNIQYYKGDMQRAMSTSKLSTK